MPYTNDQITAVMARFFPGRSIRTILDRGMWIRHNFRVELDDSRVVWLKIDADPEMGEAGEKEAYICELLRSHGLPAPLVLAFDNSREILSEPFILMEHVGGRSLDAWLRELGEDDAVPLFEALGTFFGRLHSIQNTRSGWIYGAGNVLDRHPNDFMHHAVIVGNARQLVEKGLIDEAFHRRIVSVSEALLPELMAHTPSLVCSTLHWTIYLDRTPNGWAVTKLTDLHDALYWDPANNLSGIKYPAFGQSNARHWDAFLQAYGGNAPDERRMKYHYLLACIDGALGNYMEPRSEQNDRWKRAALTGLEALINEIEAG